MKVKIKYLIILLVMSMILTGCPPPVSLVIYNNTEKDIIVRLKNRDFNWVTNSTLEISDYGGQIAWEELESKEYNDTPLFILNLKIKDEKKIVKFNYIKVGKDYVRKINGMQVAHFQFENDGRLYHVPLDSHFPVTDKSLMIPLPDI